MSLENHFGKKTAWSLLYFLNYAYFDILPIRKFWESVSSLQNKYSYIVGRSCQELFWSCLLENFFDLYFKMGIETKVGTDSQNLRIGKITK